MTVSAETTTARGASQDTLLIDADVHEYMSSKRELLPYLDEYWQHFFKTHGFNPGGFVATDFPYGVPEGREWKAVDGGELYDLDTLRRELFGREEVSVGILGGFYHAGAMEASYEFAIATTAAYNDWQIEHWLDPEPRLRGSVHVVPHQPEIAAREIDRIAAHPQIVQVLLPAVTNRQYGDPQYRPIFEAAARNDLVVSLHHGTWTKTNFGYPRNFVEWWTLAAPGVAINQLTSLICNGVFDKFPTLKVVLPEAGVAWVPWFIWRMDESYLELKAEIPWVKRKPGDHMRESVRIGIHPLDGVTPEQLADLVEMTESERMFVFSTDYPHNEAGSAEALLAPLPAELRERIRYRNALETYPRLASLLDA